MDEAPRVGGEAKRPREALQRLVVVLTTYEVEAEALPPKGRGASVRREVVGVLLEQELRAANPSLEVVPVPWGLVSTNEIPKPRDRGDSTVFRRANPPVDVLDRVEGFVERLRHGSINRRRPEMRYEVRHDHLRDVSVEGRTRTPRSIHPSRPAHDDRRAFEARERHLQSIRNVQVVVVQESDVASSCSFEAAVAGSGRAAVRGLTDDPDAFVREAVERHRATIVDHDHFEVGDGLAEYRCNGLPHVCRPVERRDDDAEQGSHGLPRTSAEYPQPSAWPSSPRVTIAPTRPTVLVVVSTFPKRSETAVIDHIRGLQAHGWDIHVACLSLDAGLLGEHRALSAALRSVHALGQDAARPRRAITRAKLAVSCFLGLAELRRSPVLRRGAYLAPRLAEVIEAVGPHVVHAHWGPNAVAAALATARSRVPVVADLHGYDLTRIPHREGWRAYRVSLARCTLVVHSSFARRIVQEHLGLDPLVCPFGVDRVFAPSQRSVAWPRPLRLLTVGRLVPEKGHDTAIVALAGLRGRRPELDARLTIVGTGPDREGLQRLANEVGVGDNVTFAGGLAHAEVAERMRESDVLVVASRAAADGWLELFGRVAAEGICTGLAVVVTAHGGLSEVVGEAGIIVAREGPAAVAEVIESLVDHDRPIDVAARARRRASAFALEQSWATDDRVARQAAGMSIPVAAGAWVEQG